jgi:uncharacterized protein YejL (UPF0352 family)
MRRLLFLWICFYTCTYMYGQEVVHNKAIAQQSILNQKKDDKQGFYLENGLKVVLHHRDQESQIQLKVKFINSPDPVAVLAGLPEYSIQLVKHTLQKKRSLTIKVAEVDKLDYSNPSQQSLILSVSNSSLEKVLASLAEYFKQPEIDRATFETVQQLTIQALLTAENNADILTDHTIKYIDIPNGAESKIATPVSIANINTDDVLAYLRKYIKPQNIELEISGNLNSDKLKAIILPYFETWVTKSANYTLTNLQDSISKAALHFIGNDGTVNGLVTYFIPLPKINNDTARLNSLWLCQYLKKNIFDGLQAAAIGLNDYIIVQPKILYNSNTDGITIRLQSNTAQVIKLIKTVNTILDTIKLPMVTPTSLSSVLKSYPLISKTIYASSVVEDTASTIKFWTQLLNNNSSMSWRQQLGNAGTASIIVVGQSSLANRLKRLDMGKVLYYRDHYGKAISAPEEMVVMGKTATDVWNDYIAALGGVEAIQQLKNIQIVAQVKWAHQEYVYWNVIKDQEGYYQAILQNNKPINKVVWNTKGGYIEQSSTKMVMSKSLYDYHASLADLQVDLHLEKYGITLKLLGTGKVDTALCYVLEKNVAENKRTTMLYISVATNLLLQEVIQDQKEHIIKRYTNYKIAQKGSTWLYPFIQETVGGALLEVKNIRVNDKIRANYFE